MKITRKKINNILSLIPKQAKCCYTGQSILAYCPDPTFSFEEINSWEDETDVDIFAYNQQTQASLVQLFISNGWTPANEIEEFKANRIRFWQANSKFSLQTVKLVKPDYPILNISWRKNQESAMDIITGFDMDYLMVALDLSTRVYSDLRPENKHIAHVNPYNARFDPDSVDSAYWYRQFERCPKAWSRGIDSRPVAEQYARWIESTLEKGDLSINSKTREYAERAMHEAISVMLQSGFTQEQSESLYHMVRGEDTTWDAMKIQHTAMLHRITQWLDSVKED